MESLGSTSEMLLYFIVYWGQSDLGAGLGMKQKRSKVLFVCATAN